MDCLWDYILLHYWQCQLRYLQTRTRRILQIFPRLFPGMTDMDIWKVEKCFGMAGAMIPSIQLENMCSLMKRVLSLDARNPWKQGWRIIITGTEQVPAVIAFRAQVFDGFAGTIEAILEEQNGVTQTVFLNADNFYEWNLSTGSGTYRIQSVSATEGDLSFVTEFSNMYQNLPEEGLLVQKITVTEVVIEKIPAAGEESQAAEKNENPIDEMNVLPQKGQEEETEGILENQAQEVNIVDAVKQKNPFILLGVGVALIAAIGGLIWSKKR